MQHVVRVAIGEPAEQLVHEPLNKYTCKRKLNSLHKVAPVGQLIKVIIIVEEQKILHQYINELGYFGY